ncbi:hypothetical protein KDAU_56650 [Dictyobacter aurantiacus]|uniref:Uncharacterized protein n=1 Tax=Dictyobacter aurantiacus TaxID=1936993 RepID=A0A401ZNJ6_9CHLR|nr:hypothetical protein KDAU_56650 [Dictyobacter aurantiacus]
MECAAAHSMHYYKINECGRVSGRPCGGAQARLRHQLIKPAWRLNTFEQGEAKDLVVFDRYEGQESANLLIFEWQQSLW